MQRTVKTAHWKLVLTKEQSFCALSGHGTVYQGLDTPQSWASYLFINWRDQKMSFLVKREAIL